ncbi:hypothetical protein HA402_000358 [Bradysia odoriphaga]|nr:hypothetical protein HA402_000358 [Bradysia odoriphaga]
MWQLITVVHSTMAAGAPIFADQLEDLVALAASSSATATIKKKRSLV